MAESCIAARCSGCGRSLKVNARLAGKQVKCPECGQAVRVSTAAAPGPVRPRSRIIAAVLLAASLGVALCLVVILIATGLQRRRPAGPEPELPVVAAPKSAFMETVVGHRKVDGIEDDDFYHDEGAKAGNPFRWTNGNAKLVIPLDPKDPPRSLFVRLIRPKGNWFQINLNGKQLVKEPAIGEKTASIPWERTFDLNGIDLGDKAVVELLSDTVVPADVSPKSTDARALGVRLYAVKFQRQ